MFQKYVFILLTCVLSTQTSYAQLDSTRVVVENGFIEKMRNHIAIENSINNEYETFEVKTSGDSYNISPNIRTNYRLQLNYKFILAGIQFAPSFFPNNGDNASKGETKSFNLKVKIIQKHWYTTLQYSKIHGFYLANSDEFINLDNNTRYIQFPDLHYAAYEIEAGYIQNSKFSYRSVTSHMERQLKSTGSFIPVLKVRHYTLDDQSSDIDTQKSNNLEFTFGPGYAYNFIFKENFYATAGALISLGNINTKLTTRYPTDELISYQNNFLLQYQGKLGLGFNGNRFYSGVFATISETNYKQEHTTATNTETRVFYNLFIGFRLKAPKAVKKQINKIENTLHL